jgi:hypothetical protein
MVTPQAVQVGVRSPLLAGPSRHSTLRRRPVLSVLAVTMFVAALLVVGLAGLIPFGLLVAFSADSDVDTSQRSVRLTRRNAVLAVAMVAVFAGFWLWHLDLTESTLMLLGAALMTLPMALQDSVADTASDRTVVVTKRSLILAVWALAVFVGLYYAYGQSINMLAAVCVVVPLALVASRGWRARMRRVEFGLLRHPLDRELRPHLVQALNIWVCCALLGGVLAAGGIQFARIWLSLNATEFGVVVVTFAAGLVLLAALALIPLRRVHVPTNVVVALLSGFLAVQLAQVSVSRSDAVVLDSPLVGEWFVLNGGHSVLLNGHSPNESNALDFVRLGTNGRTHTGGNGAPLSEYAGFGWPVLAPSDERIVEVSDGNADSPAGTNSDHSNHLLIDIGGGRYVSMAHLMQGSATVKGGDMVRSGQPVAAVGNNGNSSEPHLHLQVQDSRASTDADRTYPMVFRDVDISRGGGWPFGDRREPRTGDLVERPTT